MADSKVSANPENVSNSKEQAEKDRNTQIVKHATAAFLEYRRALSTIMAPELGVIDDLTVTWLARYTGKPDAEPSTGTSASTKAEPEAENIKKFGRMHVSLHTKTAPDAETGRQVFNSFTIDSNVSFEHDPHPLVEEQELKAKKDAEAKEKEASQAEKIDEIVTAAAAASSD